MKTISILSVLVGITGLLLFGGPTGEVWADGTETLGPPSISISQGTDVVAAGVGLKAQPGDIVITVPDGAAVTQVLLYWEGFMLADAVGDDTITVNGNSVTGTLIGGPAFFFGGAYSSAFRADITLSGLVVPGTNTLTVGGLDFTAVSNGAGVVVIYDDGSGITDIDIRDGVDLAFINFPEPRKSTIPQTFTFDPSPVDRLGTLAMFFSSVAGDASGGGTERPSSIEITVDGTTTTFSNQLDSNDGQEWDTVNASVTIPAGAESLTVQAFSRDDFGDGQDPLAASFVWTAAAFSIQGCSIGDYVWEDADRDGCQDDEERGINGVTVELYENCDFEGVPITFETITEDGQDGFYEFKNLVCGQKYGIRFVDDPTDIYVQTDPNSCFDDPSNPNDNNDTTDSDCGDDGQVCATAGDENAAPGSDNPTIDCGYVCEGKIGDYVWLDENEDGCQDEVNTGIAGADVTLSEDCVVRENPKTVQTNPDGFYEFAGLCPGDYFVEFGNGRPNTMPGQSCDSPNPPTDPPEKDSNCGDDALQCVELTKDNPEDPTIDCGKVGPCLELEKRVSGDGGVNFFDADNCSDADVPFTTDDSVYELVVTNCGKEAVELNRIIDQDLGINLVLDDVLIPPDDSVTFTNNAPPTKGLLQKEGACPNPEGEFDNTATVFGTGDGSNLPVEATDPACVKCGPCIKIQKNVRDAENNGTYQPANSCSDDKVVPINNGAEYRLRVSNCGAENLTGVVINDDKLEITDFSVGDLAVDETKNFFFDRPGDGIKQLLQSDLCEEISPELQFLNRASTEGIGEDSGITVTDSNPACVECQPECDIQVTKTCAILPPPPGPEVSTCSDLKDVTGLTMIWKGQDGVNIQTELGQVINGINKGDIVFLNTPKDQTGNDVQVFLSGSVSGESEFHISCSDQDMNGIEDCGKAQGNGKSNDSSLINDWEFGGMTGEKGQFTCPNAQPDPNGFPTETEECEFTPLPEGGNCDDIKDITALTLVWDGPSGLNIVSEVGQVINDIQKGEVILLNTPKDQTGNDVEVTLTGSVTGASEFHISCSDNDMDGPEDCGSAQGNGKGDDASLNNQWLFGGMTGEKGSFGCPGVPGPSDSAEVIYGIRVENLNDEAVEVRIFDAKLGIDEMETIAANDTFELVTDPITVTPDNTNEFTNTVVVVGETESGAECEASDSVTVKRNPPPPPPVSCSDIKDITALRLVWDGPSGINILSETGQVINDINTGDIMILNTPKDETGNDVDLTISGAVSGMSQFHISCSDSEMNGSEDCGTNQGNGKSNDASRINDWLLDGMTGENGAFVCNIPEATGDELTGTSGSGGMVTGAATLDLGDDKKVKWELTNNGTQDVFVTRVVVAWPSEHKKVKKFKLDGDFASDVSDDTAPTAVPDEKAFESDPKKRKLKKGDHKKLEIEFTEKFKDHAQSDFTLSVEFDNGQTLNFP